MSEEVSARDSLLFRYVGSLGVYKCPSDRASYHNGAGGLSFADGHSEIKKWRSPLIESYGRQSRWDTRLDTLDATWLWERTTKF